jgi:replicative DNA helicase|tara:strand:+ start:318 stop:1682 length:1365 start_codon:yes stop_codon:yes gene_type:complete
MTDRLSSYGYAFQIKVITGLLVDKSFLQQISDILSPKYFESDANNWIVSTILDYQREYNASPTLEVMKVKLEKVEQDVLKDQVVAHLKDAWKYTESSDLPYIKDQAMDFCKNQEIKKAILGSVELLKNGDYDGIKATVDNALKAGADKDIGHDYMVDIDARYTDAVRFVQPTPWDVINELTDGGLGKGELGVMVAPAGIGKSWALMNVGAHLIKQGKTVVHYTLELNEAYVGLRYDSVITGIANQNLKHYQEDIKETLSKIKGELIIKHYPTKSVGVMGIRAHIEKCIMQDKKPDVIIVDYADLLRGHGQEKRHELEGIYEDLRGMAGEYEIPVWTASQANRSALEEDVIDASKVSESYGKVMVADFVLSLSRKVQDKLAGTGRWHVIKNRFGPDGITLPSKMNTSNGQFNIYTDTSIGGRETQKQMDGGDDLARKMLSRKYQETQNDSMVGFE